MNTEELSNRLTQIVQGLTNTHPIRIKATIEVFLKEFDPGLTLVLDLFYILTLHLFSKSLSMALY